MILSTKLVNLLGILAIGSFSLEVAVANDDLDDSLKEALFLVRLLKSDFAQVLRANDDVMTNSTEDENSTCSLPSEEFNSTMAMDETVTVSRVTPSTPATAHPSTPVAPPAPPSPPNVLPPGAPMMMPYANWPSMSMGYPPPPSGPGRQNFPDENYRFPYRLNRRRMMPDYYYFDSPVTSRGKFRRFDNDPTDDLGNTPATSQAQTPSSLSSATSAATTLHVEETTASRSSLHVEESTTSTTSLHVEETTALTTFLHVEETTASTTFLHVEETTASTTSLHVEETMASTTSLPTTLAQPSTSILPATEPKAILQTTISANHTILMTADSAKQSISADPSKQTSLPTLAKSILLKATYTKQSILPTTEERKLPTIISSTLITKHRKRVRHRKRLPVSKATTKVISNRNKHHLKVSHHLRHRTHHTTTTEKLTKDYVEMSQVASELEKELESTNTEDVQMLHASYKDSKHPKLKKHGQKTTTRRTTTTMKVFLQGSSRIPIPFPENNGFCHFHPENALCGAN